MRILVRKQFTRIGHYLIIVEMLLIKYIKIINKGKLNINYGGFIGLRQKLWFGLVWFGW